LIITEKNLRQMIKRRLIESRKSLAEEFDAVGEATERRPTPRSLRGVADFKTPSGATMRMTGYIPYDDGDVLTFNEDSEKGDYGYAYKIKNDKKWLEAGPDDIEVAVTETPKGLEDPIFVKKGSKSFTALAELFEMWQKYAEAADIKDADERKEYIEKMKADQAKRGSPSDNYDKARSAMMARIKKLKSYNGVYGSTIEGGQLLRFEFSEWDEGPAINVRVRTYFNLEATGSEAKVKCVIENSVVDGGKEYNSEGTMKALARAVSEEGQNLVMQDEVDNCEVVAEFLGGRWTAAGNTSFSNKNVCSKIGNRLYMARAVWSKEFTTQFPGTTKAAKNEAPSKELDAEAAAAMKKHMDTSKIGGEVVVGDIVDSEPNMKYLFR